MKELMFDTSYEHNGRCTMIKEGRTVGMRTLFDDQYDGARLTTCFCDVGGNILSWHR